MKQVDVMPTEGQFVGVWVYGCDVWSDTYQWTDDGALKRYCVIPESLVAVTEVGDIWESTISTDEFPWGREDNPADSVTFFVM